MTFVRHSLSILAGAFALGVAAAPAGASGSDAAAELRTAADGEWVSVTGKIRSLLGPDSFAISYGDGAVAVEVDGYVWNQDKALAVGDTVTITGRMDKDFFENKKIEASTVYAPKLREFFYANPADEEGYYSPVLTPYGAADLTMAGDWVSFIGTVASLDGDTFTLDVGFRTVEVGTSDMKHNPLGDVVTVGDRVAVTGETENIDLFGGREVEAASVVLLTNVTN